MVLQREQHPPPDLTGRVDRALEALWHGDSTPFESLLESDDVSGLPVGELLKGVASMHTGPAIGLPDRAEIAGCEIIDEIGRGGMGVVYRARQLSTKRVVALKVMLTGPFASQAGRRRFQREVELTARLQHAAIVRVLEGGQASNGLPWYAMDYVEGVPLNRWLSVSRPDVSTTLGLFHELCEAVDYAHRHRVIHRDLKPGNVLVDEEGRPHVLDFGLAKAADRSRGDESLTANVSWLGQVVGTLRYVSPEQAAGAATGTDARTDVYSLGVMLFEALTGSLPFDDTGRPSEIARRTLEQPPKRPSLLSERVDGELETIILKALEKDKTCRYSSAHDMGEDLRRYLAGEPILARRLSTVYVLRKKLRRHRVACGLTAAGLVLGLGALFGGLWLKRQGLNKARSAVAGYQSTMEVGQPELALGKAQALAEGFPGLPEARLLWAQAQFRVGRRRRDEDWSNRAIMTLRAGLRQDPSQAAYRALLAEIYYRTNDVGWQQFRSQAEAQPPDTAGEWYIRSFATLDIDKAVGCAEQALNLDPRHEPARERLYRLYLRTNNLEAALMVTQEAVGPKAWTGQRGHVLVRQGRYLEAVNLYTQEIIGDPAALGYYRPRAVANLCLGAYDKAIEDYSEYARRTTPVLGGFWIGYFRATPLWITGRREEAAEDYRKAHSLMGRVSYGNVRLFLVLHDQARALEEQGRLAGAQQALSEARDALEAARRGSIPGSWLNTITNFFAGELTPDELVAAAGPTNEEWICESYYYAGEACLLKGQIAEALEWFEKCVQTNLMFDVDGWPPVPMNEYHLARWRVNSLSPDGATALQAEQEE